MYLFLRRIYEHFKLSNSQDKGHAWFFVLGVRDTYMSPMKTTLNSLTCIGGLISAKIYKSRIANQSHISETPIKKTLLKMQKRLRDTSQNKIQ